jgi:hypothetical protein
MTHLTLEERVERLESHTRCLDRQSRRLKALAVALVATFAAVVCMGQVGVPKVVEAEKFVLRDADGKQRAVLELTKDTQPALVLFDADGKQRVRLSVEKDDVGVHPLGVHALGVLVLHEGLHDTPSTRLDGRVLELGAGISRVSGWARLGPGNLTLASGQYRGGTSYAALHAGRAPVLNLYNAAGVEGTATLGYHEPGEWGLSISRGKGSASIGVTVQGEPSVDLLDTKGDTLFHEGTGRPLQPWEERPLHFPGP